MIENGGLVSPAATTVSIGNVSKVAVCSLAPWLVHCTWSLTLTVVVKGSKMSSRMKIVTVAAPTTWGMTRAPATTAMTTSSKRLFAIRRLPPVLPTSRDLAVQELRPTRGGGTVRARCR